MPAADSTLFSLQVGAFASEANARAQIEEIADGSHEPYLITVIDDHRTLYTVRLGRYENRESALAAADDLRRTLGLSAVIRPIPAG